MGTNSFKCDMILFYEEKMLSIRNLIIKNFDKSKMNGQEKKIVTNLNP